MSYNYPNQKHSIIETAFYECVSNLNGLTPLVGRKVAGEINSTPKGIKPLSGGFSFKNNLGIDYVGDNYE